MNWSSSTWATLLRMLQMPKSDWRKPEKTWDIMGPLGVRCDAKSHERLTELAESSNSCHVYILMYAKI